MQPRKATIILILVVLVGGLAILVGLLRQYRDLPGGSRPADASGLPSLPAAALEGTKSMREAFFYADRDARGLPNNADRLGRLATLYHANQFYPEATTVYRRAMTANPADPRWPYYLARLRLTQGENEAAVPLLQTVIGLTPYAPARQALAASHFKSERLELAQAEYTACLAADPSDAYAHIGLARVAMARQAWADAERHLLTATSLNGELGPAHQLLTAIYQRAGRDAEATTAEARAAATSPAPPYPDPWLAALIDFCHDPDQLLILADRAVQERDGARASRLYQRVIEVAPEDGRVHREYADALIRRGQYIDALRMLERAAALAPDDAATWRQRGYALMECDRLDEAEAALAQALRLNGADPATHTMLGAVATRQGEVAEALSHYRKALRLDPEHVRAHSNLGHVLSQAGRSDDAERHYRAALAVSPDDADSLVGLGALHVRAGRLDEAVACYRGALRTRADNPSTHYDLGVVLAETGHGAEAIAHYRRALELDPRHFPALINLGVELQADGALTAAVDCYREALELVPKHVDLRNNLGFALMQLERWDEAKRHLQRALEIDPAHRPAQENLRRLEERKTP